MIKKTLRLLYTFYTRWGIVFHLLFFLGVFPNTRIIALFIFLISQYFLLIRPGYLRMYGPHRKLLSIEAIFHWLPLLIIPYGVSFEAGIILVVSLLIYLTLHGYKKINTYYEDMFETLDRIEKDKE